MHEINLVIDLEKFIELIIAQMKRIDYLHFLDDNGQVLFGLKKINQ